MINLKVETTEKKVKEGRSASFTDDTSAFGEGVESEKFGSESERNF